MTQNKGTRIAVQSIEPMNQEGSRAVMIKTIEIDTGQSTHRYGLPVGGFPQPWETAGLARWCVLMVV